MEKDSDRGKKCVEFICEWPPPPSPAPPCKKLKSALELSKCQQKQRRQQGNESADSLESVCKLLATWWRRLPPEKREDDSSSNVESNSPYARMVALSKKSIGKEFLESRIRELSSFTLSASSHHLYTLTTIYHLLRKDELAARSADKALQLCQLRHLHECDSIADNLAYVKGLSAYEREILRIATLAHLQHESILSAKESKDDIKVNGCQYSSKHEVEVVQASHLSLEDFREKYSRGKKPVIIEELTLTNARWTLDYVKSVAGGRRVPLRCARADSTEWAKLEAKSGESPTLGEFIDRIKDGVEKEGYLFDWSLPLFCPELSSQIGVPAYFDCDYLKKVDCSLYKASWPSLFISPAGTVSDLHIDAFGSNFWMALFAGSKKWTFFPADVASRLRPRYIDTFDPVFDIDCTSADDADLCASLSPYSVILRPGQVLFVPAGCPHRVENLESSVAVSGNFVDDSNVTEAAVHLVRNALTDCRAGDLLEEWIQEGLVPPAAK